MCAIVTANTSYLVSARIFLIISRIAELFFVFCILFVWIRMQIRGAHCDWLMGLAVALLGSHVERFFFVWFYP